MLIENGRLKWYISLRLSIFSMCFFVSCVGWGMFVFREFLLKSRCYIQMIIWIYDAYVYFHDIRRKNAISVCPINIQACATDMLDIPSPTQDAMVANKGLVREFPTKNVKILMMTGGVNPKYIPLYWLVNRDPYGLILPWW